MISLDPRRGSGDLLPLFAGLAESRWLEFGDAAWTGSGPDDTPVLVGAEIKKLSDVLQCIGNGRYTGHQLIGMYNTYNVRYLILEGVWKRDRDGVMVTPRRRGDATAYWVPVTLGHRNFMVRDFECWLASIEELGGVRVRRTTDRRGTVACVLDLYHWWTDKEYDRHRTMCQFDNSQAGAAPMLKPGLVRRVAKELPGIGWDRSAHVARKFASVREMVLADEGDWREIRWETPDGKKQSIGPVTAEKVVAAIQGGTPR